MNFADNGTSEKLRGGYYTSPGVAAWLCAWAIRTVKDRVLEPSCGDGVFLEAATDCFKRLGARRASITKNLTGVEIISSEAARARAKLKGALGQDAQKIVETTDFFRWWRKNRQAFDVVIGNPPFIRYQTFPEPHRSLAMDIMAELGLAPNRLTNIWVPFVAAAAARLRPGGRLALVLPAELLQVTYAAQLRSFLTDRFARIDIVACNELFFDNAEQEVVLLLADGAQGMASAANSCRVSLTETRTVAELTSRPPSTVLAEAEMKTIQHDSEKWLKYFLTQHEIDLMRALRASDATTTLATYASVDVGVVTGKNEFFVLTHKQVEEFGLGGCTIPLVSRSAHLKGAKLGKSDWKALSSAGDRVHLLHLRPTNGGELPIALKRYIHQGEVKSVHKGYKCSIRDPWYAVPAVWVPDGFVFRQIYDFPRLVLNQAGATSTDTIHRLRCNSASPEAVVANTYTWLTAASAEIEGRSYGGGVLELEPTEAENLLMPATLNGAVPLADCDRLTRAGRLSEVLEENARIILSHQLGLSKKECGALRGIWERMRDRRQARRRRRIASAPE